MGCIQAMEDYFPNYYFVSFLIVSILFLLWRIMLFGKYTPYSILTVIILAAILPISAKHGQCPTPCDFPCSVYNDPGMRKIYIVELFELVFPLYFGIFLTRLIMRKFFTKPNE
jgi:hypothetical protein